MAKKRSTAPWAKEFPFADELSLPDELPLASAHETAFERPGWDPEINNAQNKLLKAGFDPRFVIDLYYTMYRQGLGEQWYAFLRSIN